MSTTTKLPKSISEDTARMACEWYFKSRELARRGELRFALTSLAEGVQLKLTCSRAAANKVAGWWFDAHPYATAPRQPEDA